MDKREGKANQDSSPYPVRIDYDKVDVADIMGQIKKRIAENPSKDFGEEPPHPTPGSAQAGQPQARQAPQGLKEKVRAKLARLMAPFFPLIRLLVLPVHEELVRTIENLHEANKRIDRLSARMGDLDQSIEYTKLLHNLSHNIVVELSKLRIEVENLKVKARILEKDFDHLGKREKVLEKQIFK